jgi:Xaa-Pro dipeptidase
VIEVTMDITAEPVAKELSFTVDEYRDRIERLRLAVAERGCAGALVFTPENLTYLTGYRTPGYYGFQALVVPVEGEPMLVLRHFETENAARYGVIDHVVGVTDDSDPLARLVEAVRELGLAGEDPLGVELGSWFFTPRQVNALSAALSGTPLVDVGGTAEELRLVKSEAEIAHIRTACRQAEAGMLAGIGAVRPGVTENDVAAAAVAALVAAGCEYWSLPPFVCSGPRTAIPHATWAGRPLERGDVVYFELPGCSHRYGAGLMRTVVLGPPAEWQSRLAAASLAGLEAAIAAIRPGVPASAVDAACRAEVAAAGFDEGFRHRTGYSIGVNFPPDWGEGHICHLKAGDDRPLEPGMVFHLVPQIFDGRRASIGFSETVLVTEDGCEVLTRFPRQFREI